MSFQAFLNDPKSYLNVHRMMISQGMGANLVPGALTKAAAVANTAHGTSIQYTHTANLEMILDPHQMPLGSKSFGAMALGKVGLMDKRLVTYRPNVGGNWPNLRFLPYSATDVTFMQLGGGADFALTGPLQGCTLSVVSHIGAIWFFHANVSGAGGVTPANRATKRQMIRNAGTIAGIPPTANYFFCEYGPGFQYDGWGFVWGRIRAGGNWKFYVHCIQPPAQGALLNVHTIDDVKWADL